MQKKNSQLEKKLLTKDLGFMVDHKKDQLQILNSTVSVSPNACLKYSSL